MYEKNVFEDWVPYIGPPWSIYQTGTPCRHKRNIRKIATRST